MNKKVDLSKVIAKYCLKECSMNSRVERKNCIFSDCILYPYRMGEITKVIKKVR